MAGVAKIATVRGLGKDKFNVRVDVLIDDSWKNSHGLLLVMWYHIWGHVRHVDVPQVLSMDSSRNP